MFDKPRYQMDNWRRDNPHAISDQDNCCNPQRTSAEKVKCTGHHFSSYGRNDLLAKVDLPSYRQYKPGDFLAIKLLNCNETIDKDDGDENWAN